MSKINNPFSYFKEADKFGDLDGDSDPNLINYYVDHGLEASIENNKEKFIIVGAKGTGKSASKKMLMKKKQKDDKLVIDIQLDLQRNDLEESNNLIEKKVENFLLISLLKYFVTSEIIKPSDRINKVLTLFRGVTINAFVVRISFKDYVNDESEINIDEIREDLKKFLKENEIWIFIDELGSQLPQANSNNINSLSIIIRTLKKFYMDFIITEGKGRYPVRIVLFLQNYLYMVMKKEFVNFDHLKNNFVELEWGEKELKDVITNRIKWILKEKNNEMNEALKKDINKLYDWKLWGYLFNETDKEKIEKFQSFLSSFAFNGPRDIISLIKDQIYENSRENIEFLSIDKIYTQVSDYGIDILENINLNNNNNFNNIDQVIVKIFKKELNEPDNIPYPLTFKPLTDEISSKVMYDNQFIKQCNDVAWLKEIFNINRDINDRIVELIEILYKLNILGYKENENNSEYKFVLKYPLFYKNRIQSDSYLFKVHTALEKCLNLS